MNSDDFLMSEDLRSFRRYLQNAERFDGKKVTDEMPIFRYLSKDRFLNMVENWQLVLAHISLWQDPFEGILFRSSSRSTNVARRH